MKHIVISDLHLGMGRDAEGNLDPLEDFDSDAEFDQLLELALQNGRSLVINGDWLDFLQVEPFVDIGAFESMSGVPLFYTAREAQEKLDTILSRQARHFAALRSFISDKGRIVVVQGNHDADWFFPPAADGAPPLQKRVREVLGAPDDNQLRFVDTHLRIGSVHIEHGHQRCELLNGFQGHPDIFHADRASALGTSAWRMELLWGSRLVVEFFNRLEREFPFADNLKPTTRALWLGIRSGWVDGKTAGRFLRFLLGAGIPWRQLPEVLEPPPPNADAAIQSLEDPGLKSLLLERVGRDADFEKELSAELNRAPREEKAQWHESTRSAIGFEEVAPLGEAGVAGVIRDSREFREARLLLEDSAVSAVVFGHTHFAIDGFAADAKVPGYFNSGTWIPSLNLKDPKVEHQLKTEKFPLALLKDRSWFQRRLTYVEVPEPAEGGRILLREIAA